MKRRPTHIVSSDLQRAAKTARVIADSLKLEPVFDPRLRELSFGEWEGRPWSEIEACDGRAPAWANDWVNVAPPSGESGAAFNSRIRDALCDLVQLASRGDVLVITHAGWMRLAAAAASGEPVADSFARHIRYLHAAILASGPRGVALHAWDILL